VIIVLALALGAGLALRLPRLDLRPMHGDEAVHAVKFAELWQTGAYRYDPHEYHGPTLYYATLPVVWLAGARDFAATTKATYRIVPVVFGIALIALLWLVRDGLGRGATAVAACLTALSPALVFYSRYYIQEMLLVFFAFVVIAAGWRYARMRAFRRVPSARGTGWLLLLGGALGAMHATKETAILMWGAMAGALLGVWWWHARTAPAGVRGPDGQAPASAACRAPVTLSASGVVLASAVITSALLFSVGGTYWQGPLDSLRTYATYTDRAAGGMHTQPWNYYLRLLLYSRAGGGPVWSEALIVLLAAVAGFFLVFRPRPAPTPRALANAPAHATPVAGSRALVLFIALYTVLLTAAYSIIPYKTPWCVLGPLHGMVLLAGVGTAGLWRSLPHAWLRGVLALILLAGGAHLGRQAWLAAQHPVFAGDRRNPYIYAHPVRDVEHLAARVTNLARLQPGGDPLIKVLVANPWPLPWYLRALPRVGYWEEVPAVPDADIILVSSDWQAELEPRLQAEYVSSNYGLRRDEILTMYVQRGLWDRFLAAQAVHDE
jgi:uncharacterized protein (TIGR03663 family)